MQKGTCIVEVKIVAFSTQYYSGTVDEGSVYNRTVDVRPPVCHLLVHTVLSLAACLTSDSDCRFMPSIHHR